MSIIKYLNIKFFKYIDRVYKYIIYIYLVVVRGVMMDIIKVRILV